MKPLGWNWRALLTRQGGPLLLLLLLVTPHPSFSQDGIVGVNITNPQWTDRRMQDAVITQLSQAGAKYVRIPLLLKEGGEHAASLDLIRRINSVGISILLNIVPLYRPNAPVRPAFKGPPELWPSSPYSAVDPNRTRSAIEPLLRDLDRHSIKLAAIEVGNEINWTPFNGDFTFPGDGRIFGLSDLRADPKGQAIAAGFRAYIDLAREIKNLRDTLNINRSTPIISAGLADFAPAGATTGTKADAVSPDATLAYMKEHGLDDVVDGYGIHTYKIAGIESKGRAEAIGREFFSYCGAPPVGKPCWLTEWGVNSDTLTCPQNDARRVKIVGNWMTFLRQLHQEQRLTASFYYTWTSVTEKYGIYQCGSLSPSGVSAIAPNALD